MGDIDYWRIEFEGASGRESFAARAQDAIDSDEALAGALPEVLRRGGSAAGMAAELVRGPAPAGGFVELARGLLIDDR